MHFRFPCCPFLSLIFLVSACQILDSDTPQEWLKTYPPALDLPVVTLTELSRVELDNGEFNVRASVVAVSQCFPDMMCSLPDTFTLADSYPVNHESDLRIRVIANTPRQLRIGREYLFSIHVDILDINNADLHRYSLLGYD